MGYDEGVVALMDHHLERREPDSVLQIAFAARNAMDLRFTKLQNLRANAAGSLVIRDLGPTPREVTTQTWTHAIVACAMKKALHPLLKIGAVPIGPSHAKFIAPSFDAPFMQYLSSVASRYHLGAPDSFLLNLPQRLKNLEQVAIPAPAFRRFVTRLERLPIRRHLLTIAQIVKTELLQADPLLIVDGADSVKARTHLRFVFTVDHWASLTIALARLGDENALETFCTSMHEIAGETPSLVKAALIEGYTSSHRFDKARAAAQTSISKSTPEAAVYRAHIEALLAEASYKDTLKALNLFAAHHTCINQDPEASYEGALKALDLFAAHHTCINQDPEAVSVFNTVLDWLARQSRLDEAYALLSRMQERELRPDIASFNAILRHSHDSHTIQDVLHRMDKLGVAADAETAAILLVAHLSAGADALDLVRRALNKTGTEVRSALAVDDDAQDAKWWTWWEVTSGADRKTLKAAMRAQRKRHNHRSSICNEILGRLLARDDDAGFNAAYILLTHMWANRHIVHPTLRSSSLLTPDMNCKKWRNAKELRKEVQTRRVPSHLQSLVDALELQHTDMPSCREVD
ncbi:pentatricopeptide repeat domain-containing protein [Phanerochaete sordida]|uniref:Pentatricopeptide repeat domain-containing protein n=1 Tax=Phanerochaete sordida TaxID=48140 RepID=A0A9P3GDL0_9APHY|nr:pentatricopeptide repeat domain-containing protein [Phanerochaete sordida]